MYPTDPAQRLAELLASMNALLPRLAGAAPTPAPAPKAYLLSWHDILVAVGRTPDAANRRAVRRLNEFYCGPILLPGRGGQPRVARARLLSWWDGLEAVWDEDRRGQIDAEMTTAARHAYGRAAEVLPDLAGQVRRRRAA